MQSSIEEIVLHPGRPTGPAEPCPALNDRAPGMALCSLPASHPHVTHQLRCEDTGELLGEWTDTDMAFRTPTAEPRSDGGLSRAA